MLSRRRDPACSNNKQHDINSYFKLENELIMIRIIMIIIIIILLMIMIIIHAKKIKLKKKRKRKKKTIRPNLLVTTSVPVKIRSFYVSLGHATQQQKLQSSPRIGALRYDFPACLHYPEECFFRHRYPRNQSALYLLCYITLHVSTFRKGGCSGNMV